MSAIRWGIIGCGDVTEVKSGPAFNKIQDSELVAVMRRDAEKAKDYAMRHKVSKWYSDANKLINDPDINAIYIATPPSSHEAYTMAAIQAGKQVYVEKPMTISARSAIKMAKAAEEKNIKLVVAHYRRAQPLFNKIKQLVAEKAIGDIRLVKLDLAKKSLTKDELLLPKNAWRVDASISGGGLFHDLAPHQLDLMYYFFGEAEKVSGISLNQAGLYASDDIVAGNILFKNKILFNGSWCFNVHPSQEKDSCEIVGSEGSIQFSFFEPQPICLQTGTENQNLSFDPLQHVQQPMIEKVVDYFLNRGENPNSGYEAAMIMNWMEEMTKG